MSPRQYCMYCLVLQSGCDATLTARDNALPVARAVWELLTGRWSASCDQLQDLAGGELQLPRRLESCSLSRRTRGTESR